MDRIEKEIQRIGEDYRTTFSSYHQDFYDKFVYLMIIDEPLGDQSRLEKMWEWEKE